MRGRRSATLLALAAAAVQSAFAAVAMNRRFFLGKQEPEKFFSDVGLYFRYASRMFAGEVPYRDFLIEYPILAVPIFALPRAFAGTFEGYKIAFAAEMLLWNLAALLLVACWVERKEGNRAVAGRLGWYTLVFAATCPLLMARFDLAPMAIAFAAALAWASGRPGLGGGLAGAGVLLKIFPGAVVLPMLVADRLGRVRGALSMALTMAIASGAWLALGGKEVAKSLGYHLERGLEVGSLFAGLSVLLSWLTDVPVRTATLHASVEMVGTWPDRLAPLAFPIQLAAMGFVAWRFRRSGGRDPLRYASATLLAFILFGKVLSPQYVAWLFPFLAVQRGKVGYRGRWLLLAGVGATTLIYPWAFARLAALDGVPVIALLNARNALLLALWVWLLVAPEAAESEPVANNGASAVL